MLCHARVLSYHEHAFITRSLKGSALLVSSCSRFDFSLFAGFPLRLCLCFASTLSRLCFISATSLLLLCLVTASSLLRFCLVSACALPRRCHLSSSALPRFWLCASSTSPLLYRDLALINNNDYILILIQ